MRGRIKLAGIVAVCLVVALGIGLAIHLGNVPAGADVMDWESWDGESWPPRGDSNKFKGTSPDEWISQAKETVTIQGVVYGVLENGETFGYEGPQYIDEDGNLTNYTPDWLSAFTEDDTYSWMYMKDMYAALEHDSTNIDEALAMMENPPDPIAIPLYAEPGGGEIIGYFYYQNA